MIVDSSAVVAMVRAEDEAEQFFTAVADAGRARMSAANYLESAIVVDSVGDPVASLRLDELLRDLRVGIEPVTAAQARIARDAYSRFGKGSGHPAQLNFGDCFAYALAVDSGEPLLYKGEDFTHAGIRSALPD